MKCKHCDMEVKKLDVYTRQLFHCPAKVINNNLIIDYTRACRVENFEIDDEFLCANCGTKLTIAEFIEEDDE